MVQAIVFDAYGTLFDVRSVADACDREYRGNGEIISRIWRQKQLEYTWLRPLMSRYIDFEKVNRDGLRYALKKLGLPFTEETVLRLADLYLSLPLHPETLQTLAALNQQLLILSNGTKDMLCKATDNVGITGRFHAILSANEAKTYKPEPDVYTLALTATGLSRDDILFVSSNAWDVAGAKSFGFQVAWINRTRTIPEELDVQADFELFSLTDLLRILNP